MTSRQAGKVVFIRHGQSVWNVKDPLKGHNVRFTGWANVPLTEHGRAQAAAVGRCLKMFGLYPNAVYTSLLRRARDSLDEMARHNPSMFKVPTISSWRLNERHYGALVGMSKEEAGAKLGHDLVMGWRRSWNLAPPPLSTEDEFFWKDAPWAQPVTLIQHPAKSTLTAYEKQACIPRTESLEDCAKRVKPIWLQGIAPRVARGETVVVVAHANSIRSMIRHIDADTITDEQVKSISIPAATPLVYSFQFVDRSNRASAGGSARSGVRGLSSLSGNAEDALGIDCVREVSRALKPLGEPSRLGMTGRYLATKEILKLGGEAAGQDESDGFYDLIEKGVDDIYAYMSTSSYSLVLTDGRGRILHGNGAWESLCGYNICDIRGYTSSFLQGDMTSRKGIREIDEKLRTGLSSQINVINYRGDTGEAFENIFTIIPVYDWLKEREENLARRSSGGYRGGGLGVCYSGGVDSFLYTKQSEKFMHPSHFVAKLEGVRMRPDLPRKAVFRPADRDDREEGVRIRVEEVEGDKFGYAI